MNKRITWETDLFSLCFASKRKNFKRNRLTLRKHKAGVYQDTVNSGEEERHPWSVVYGKTKKGDQKRRNTCDLEDIEKERESCTAAVFLCLFGSIGILWWKFTSKPPRGVWHKTLGGKGGESVDRVGHWGGGGGDENDTCLAR
jgi:hypothetical protein